MPRASKHHDMPRMQNETLGPETETRPRLPILCPRRDRGRDLSKFLSRPRRYRDVLRPYKSYIQVHSTARFRLSQAHRVNLFNLRSCSLTTRESKHYITQVHVIHLPQFTTIKYDNCQFYVRVNSAV